jgi:hypothetical protein
MIMGRRCTPFPQHRGFGQVDAIILPHYDEMPSWLGRLVKLLFVPVGVLLGVEGNTAFVANGSTSGEVLGSGGVLVWGRGLRHRATAGESITLP